jgi:hypothetical protein
MLSGIVVIGAGIFAGALDASRPEAWRAALIFIVHQAAALALAFCRALWLSSALELAAGVRRPS